MKKLLTCMSIVTMMFVGLSPLPVGGMTPPVNVDESQVVAMMLTNASLLDQEEDELVITTEMVEELRKEVAEKKAAEERARKEAERITEIHQTNDVSVINGYTVEVAKLYPSLSPELLQSIIWHESRYNPNARNYDGSCVGLMQISPRWHSSRASKLGVTNFYDAYGSILLGADYLSELLNKYGSIELVLMMYNMPHDLAFQYHNEGRVSKYASSVLHRASTLQ